MPSARLFSLVASLAWLVGLRSLVVVVTAAPARADAPRVKFNRDIRPILAENCFTCHGPDKNKRESDLRLDTREGAFAPLGDHHTIAPGKPDESELLLRVAAEDESA